MDSSNLEILNSMNNVDSKKKTNIRQRIFEIIEPANKGDILSFIYDAFMIIAIAASIIPLAFKEDHVSFEVIDKITVSIFILDYVLRFLTADYKFEDKSILSFIKYPFTLWAIIDLLSILPSFIEPLNNSFKLARLTRIIKTFKIIRIFKTFRYSNSIMIIGEVIEKSKYPLIAVCTLALLYILTSSLIIFNLENENDVFKTFFDAVYWATVSLTTVGYGDIYPLTTEGRVVAMFSSLFGIALVALPSGIITAGYMDSINERSKQRDLRKNKKKKAESLNESSVDNHEEQYSDDSLDEENKYDV